MNDTQDTTVPRLLSCGPEAPTAEVAEWALGVWRERHSEAPVLLLVVPEFRHAAVAEALRSRFQKLDELAPATPEASAAVRTLLDGGATLVSGGTAGPAGFQPSLFVHLRLSSSLARALEFPAPVLGLAPLEPTSAAWQDLLRRYRCLRWEDAVPIEHERLFRSFFHVAPNDVHGVLDKWILADGYPMVLDLEKSRGATLHDSRSGQDFLDFFGCFGSTPIGWNHPALTDEAWLRSCANGLANRPANSDLYTVEMADFVQRMGEVAVPEGFKHMFFVEGGALAVENALKVAFDWKVRRNRAKGVDADVGTKVLHFTRAFHGRSGYTLSLTNTLPDKIDYFPKFEDWPRIHAPAVDFDADADGQVAHVAAEEASLAKVDAAFAQHGDDIACILIETIQCEGGDRHFRPEFLQGLQARAEKYDCLLIFDEVQTGFFGSGKPWAWEHYGATPDIFAFGKKSQQCGIMAGPKIDEVPDNVFEKSSRINSTWGGNLVDMMRATRVLEVVREDDLAANAAARGQEWLDGMRGLAKTHDNVSNVRGLGLIMGYTMPDGAARDKMMGAMTEQGLLGLSCGNRTVRFRPHLAVTSEDVASCLERTEAALKSL